MSVYKLNISKTSQPHKMALLLKRKKIKRGDKVRLVTREKLNDTSAMWGLVIFFIALAYFYDRKIKLEESSKVLNDLFRDYKSPEELEEQIEKEYGIMVEIGSGESGEEQADWEKISSTSLAGWYDEDEADISHLRVKEPNPQYNP